MRFPVIRSLCALCCALCFAPLVTLASVITVSNKPNSPAQFSTIQGAVDAAAAGDTILITGSPNQYSSTDISKRLVIIGQGYDPRKDMAYKTNVYSIQLYNGSSGTVITGLTTSIVNAVEAAVNDVKLYRLETNSAFTRTGWVISECIISGSVNMAGNNVLVSNNVITGYVSNGASFFGIVVMNNVFGNANGGFSIEGRNMTIVNNIFYHKRSEGAAYRYIALNSINCVINNNMYFNNPLPNPLSLDINGNTGSGNIEANPLFVSIDLSTYSILRTDNFQLQPGSPARLMGTDGKDIGAYGGNKPMQYPLSGEPTIPQIRTMNIGNTVIPADGTLKVKVKADAGN